MILAVKNVLNLKNTVLQSTADNSIIALSTPDTELYSKNIDINSTVICDGKSLIHIN